MQVGVDIGSYVFNAAAKTITFVGVGLTTIEQIKPIINGTRNVDIFNPLTVGKFGTLAGQVLTLDFDTTLFANTDKLYICVNLEDEPLATEATLSEINAKLNSLGQNTMANSTPVVIASDQSAIPVNSTSTDETSTTQNTTTVAASVTSVLLVNANSARKQIAIRNDSVKPMYLCFFTPATVATPFKLGKDESWIYPKWKGAIYAIWETGATGNCYITEENA